MATRIQLLAGLSYIDTQLDDLKEEFGDLPEQVAEMKTNADDAKAILDETEGILKDIRDFVSTAKVTLVELKEKEDALSKQQFLSRNNKEFDAVTKEIEHLKSEHEKLSTRMRTEGVKEENILRILEEQNRNYLQAEADLKFKRQEFDTLSLEQNDDVKTLTRKRKSIVAIMDKESSDEYARVRQFHSDAAVPIKKNSCTGCYSAVPSQKIVELRTNPNNIYFCENCGRMLVPEDMPFDESLLVF